MKNGVLPSDKPKVKNLQHMVTRYILLGDILYKKSYFKLHSDPYLRCLRPDEAKKAMQEIYDGDCENLAGGRFLTQKAMTRDTI